MTERLQTQTAEMSFFNRLTQFSLEGLEAWRKATAPPQQESTEVFWAFD